MGTTSFLGLTTTSASSGSAITFLQSRISQFSDSNSNMTLIDGWASAASGSISVLKTNQTIPINASYQSGELYLATAALFTSFNNYQIINLNLDTTVTGATQLQINSLPSKYLKKVNSSGTIVDLASGDISANQYNLFTYDGTQFVWTAMSSGSSSGTSGSGAPTTATYVLQSSNANLPNGLVLSAGSNVTVTTNASSIIINAALTAGSSGAPTNANYILPATNINLPNAYVLTAGSNITLSPNASASTMTINATSSGSGGTTYIGTSPINVSGSIISHTTSGVSSGSYNVVQVNTFGLVISGSYISSGSNSGTTYSGSSPISVNGSVISLNTSGIVSGSYNAVQVDSFGRVTAGSNISTGTSYSGSAPIGISGSVVSLNTSGVSAGAYTAANITVDQFGRITAATSGTSASNIGASLTEPLYTTGSSSDLTNYRILSAGSNITFTSASANGGKVYVNATSSSNNIWNPLVAPSGSYTYDDEFSGSSLSASWGYYDPGGSTYALTKNVDARGLVMSQSTDTNLVISGIYKSIPTSGDFTFWTKVENLTMQVGSDVKVGILISEDIVGNPTTCKHITHSWSAGNYGNGPQIDYCGIYSSFDSNYLNAPYDYLSPSQWLRVFIDRTNNQLIFGHSDDGIGWMDKTTVNPIPFTIRNIGLFMAQTVNDSTAPFTIFPFFRSLSGVSRSAILGGRKI